MQFYVGTYTRGTASEGIYRLDLNTSQVSLVAQSDNPSWLVWNVDRTGLYAVNELSSSASVSVFDSQFELLQKLPSEGGDTCHLSLSDSRLIATNYAGSSVAVYSVLDDGAIEMAQLLRHEGSGPDTQRQTAAHPHSSIIVGDRVVVADLGTDELVIYDAQMNRAGTIQVQAGAGPRLMVMDQAEKYLYLISELSNTIETYRVTANQLEHADSVSTLPRDFSGKSFTAHLQLSTDGRYLYGSNRGHDSIVVMSLIDGLPTPVQWIGSGGKHPRHFLITEDDRSLLVANRDSDNVVVFNRDAESGELERSGQVVEVPAPVCLLQI